MLENLFFCVLQYVCLSVRQILMKPVSLGFWHATGYTRFVNQFKKCHVLYLISTFLCCKSNIKVCSN